MVKVDTPSSAKRDMSRMPISLLELSSFYPSLSFRDNLAEIANNILHILICEASMQRKSHLVLKLAVGIRIILDVKSKVLVCRHHRQRLIVNVAGYATFSHLANHLVAIFAILAQQSHEIQVSARLMIIAIMIKN